MSIFQTKIYFLNWDVIFLIITKNQSGSCFVIISWKYFCRSYNRVQLNLITALFSNRIFGPKSRITCVCSLANKQIYELGSFGFPFFLKKCPGYIILINDYRCACLLITVIFALFICYIILSHYKLKKIHIKTQENSHIAIRKLVQKKRGCKYFSQKWLRER